ncbi:MAG: LD-carboxypeptidase [Acidobacteria bacterium]|nr:LD-carboxypeptidase [Acidobacteriota bacterium]
MAVGWKRPGKLLPGSRIAVVAPASAFSRTEFEKGVTVLRRMGLAPIYDDTLFSQHLCFAGADSHRAERLIHFLNDDSIDAVLCARGGYGSVRLLPYLDNLDWSAPKIFMGSSDVTALLAFFSSEQGWVSFHGPMVAGDIARERIGIDPWALLRGEGEFPVAIRDRTVCWRPGRARGILYGGCLSILCSLLGTKTRWQMEGAEHLVLFLEDIRCKPYQIDRMLTQLAQSGLMDRVRGLILGEMVECGNSLELKPVVLDALASYRFPIVYGFPSGHTSGESLILPFGIPVELRAEENLLTVLESPVREA